MNFLDKLRNKNVERQSVWTGADEVDVIFRGLELGGEVGELQGAIKKLYRAEKKIIGNTSDDIKPLHDNLREEIGDVLICLDLVAMEYGISIEECVRNKFNATSEKVGLEVFID